MQAEKNFIVKGYKFYQIGTTDGDDNIQCYLSINGRFCATYHPNEKYILVVDTEAMEDEVPYYGIQTIGYQTIVEAMEELFTRWNVLEGED